MNKRLLILNGIAIIAVVANHASFSGFMAMFFWTHRYLPVSVPNYDQMGSLSYYALIAQQKLALFSVPAFLLVSGAFIAYAARGSQSKLGWGMIKNRVLNLIPPYVIWTSIYLLVPVIFSLIEVLQNTTFPIQSFGHILDRMVIEGDYSAGGIIASFITIGGAPFFFVPLLTLFFVLSPVLAPLAKSHWKWLLVFGVLIQLGVIVRAYLKLLDIQNAVMQVANTLLSNQIAEYFLFYVIGLIVGFRLAELKQSLIKIRWVLLGSTLIFAVLAVIEAEWIFQKYNVEAWRSVTTSAPTFLYVVSFIFCFLSFEDAKIPFSNVIYRIGVATLAIYLMHQTILLILPRLVYHGAPFILRYQFIYQPLLIAIAIGIPLILMELTKRSPIRKHYRILFG